MDYKKRAIRAKNLLRDETFTGFMEDLRQEQLQKIANTTASEIEQREEYNAILRALKQIEYTVRADIDAELLINRKGTVPHGD